MMLKLIISVWLLLNKLVCFDGFFTGVNLSKITYYMKLLLNNAWKLLGFLLFGINIKCLKMNLRRYLARVRLYNPGHMPSFEINSLG